MSSETLREGVCRAEDPVAGGEGSRGDKEEYDRGDDNGDEEVLLAGAALRELKGSAEYCWVA